MHWPLCDQIQHMGSVLLLCCANVRLASSSLHLCKSSFAPKSLKDQDDGLLQDAYLTSFSKAAIALHAVT